MMRLDKLLSDSGLGSRREVKQLIKKKRVQVNGETISNDATKVDEVNDLITFDGQVVTYQQFVYVMLNKPQGVISAREDANCQTVLDLMPQIYFKQNVFPVGRLDKDTTGLLLLTNDGDMAHQLLSPKKHVDKCYKVTLETAITAEMIEALEKGVPLSDGYDCLPAKVQTTDSPTTILLTIQEGKFHQVKRMMHAVNNHVTALQRISMGTLQLDKSLPEGSFRALTDEELNNLK